MQQLIARKFSADLMKKLIARKFSADLMNGDGDQEPPVLAQNDHSENGSSSSPVLPSAAVLYRQQGQLWFRVIRSRGSSLTTGGFGIFVQDESDGVNGQEQQQQSEERPSAEAEPGLASNNGDESMQPCEQPPPSSPPTYCLFLEEALFLHEQGLLECYQETNTNPEEDSTTTLHRLDTRQLFGLLDDGVSLAVYLVYAHLRQQSFRVVRHTPTRRAILREMHEKLTEENNSNGDKNDTAQRDYPPLQALKKRLRRAAAQAPPPTVNDASSTPLPTIAFDVYRPNARFSMTAPGLPDFGVAIYSYSAPLPFGQLQQLLARDHIPLQVAAVADSGSVLLYGVTHYGVPLLNEATASPQDGTEEKAPERNKEA